MQKAAKHLSAVLGRVLFIGLSVQMLLGFVWLLRNFGSLQEYENTFYLLKVSETLRCDDYTGILYPVLLRAARGIASVLPVPCECFLSLLQLGAGFASAFFFLGGFWRSGGRERLLRIWGSLVLVTAPVALPCHLALLPCSLACSALIAQLGIFFRALSGQKEEGERREGGAAKTAAHLGGFWLLEVLLLPEFLWFGSIPLLLYAAMGIVGSTEKSLPRTMGIVLVTAVFLGVTPLLYEMTTQAGENGKMENTMPAALFRRLCGGYYVRYYGLWSEEMKDCLAQEDIEECLRYTTGISRIMREKVESVYAPEKVRALYLEAAKSGFGHHKRDFAKDLAMDLVGYGFAPVFCSVYPRMALYESFAGSNYDIMRRRTPVLTCYYVRYGSVFFVIGLVLTAILRILFRIGSVSEKKGKESGIRGIVCAALGLWICIWYVMQGYGVMDFKNSVAVTVLWFVWMCGAAIESIGQDE